MGSWEGPEVQKVHGALEAYDEVLREFRSYAASYEEAVVTEAPARMLAMRPGLRERAESVTRERQKLLGAVDAFVEWVESLTVGSVDPRICNLRLYLLRDYVLLATGGHGTDTEARRVIRGFWDGKTSGNSERTSTASAVNEGE